MIEQLWYTWAPVGLGNKIGFRVRAASEGVIDMKSQRFLALQTHLNYSVPIGTKLSEATAETAPLSLSYVNTENEHILVHKAFIGENTYGYRSAYFIHLLASLPKTFSARDAIDL